MLENGKNQDIKYWNSEHYSSGTLRELAKKCYAANDDKIENEPDFEAFVATLPNKGEIYPNLIGGSRTLTKTLKLIESDTCPQPILLDYQRNNWNMIGQCLLDWGIARKAEAISWYFWNLYWF